MSTRHNMKLNKNIIIGIIGVLIIVLVFVVNAIYNNKDNLLSGKHYVEMTVKDYGDIILELDADTAPITVTNFINLVKDGYYDGLTFHRIIEGFMIQGGAGEKTDTIKGEFEANGIENDISHVRGVISMARADDFNSASSQFFIVHEDSTSLDGNYAAFGYVIAGMDVVDEIAKVETDDPKGIVDLDKRPVIESIKVIEVGETLNVNYN